MDVDQQMDEDDHRMGYDIVQQQQQVANGVENHNQAAAAVDGGGPEEVTFDEDYADQETDADAEGLALEQLQRRGLLPTGCCYDVRMKMHMNADFSPNAHHPEDPRRIHEIFEAFKRNGLVYTGPQSELPKILKRTPTRYMWRIPARNATRGEICLAHSPEHLAWVESLDTMSTAELRELTKRYDQGRESLYVGAMSHAVARLSAGGAIETCKAVVDSRVKNAFAVIRPPGHHAEFDCPMGFCIFNNVPVAVRVCQADYAETCRKVLILDWDVHHGNGVQNIFYDDPNVLYISLHVYQNGHFYPGKPPNPMTPDGGIDQCGMGMGLGRNVNIPWHDQGMGDGEYMAAFQKIVMPIAHEFNPDLVVISAGFDAADGDELGGCFVSPTCYAHMTHMLMSLAGGKVAVCLEGGYNLRAISDSAVAVAKTLMGEPPPRMDVLPKINKEAARTIANVRAYQAPYWECMRSGVVDVPDVQSLGAERLHDVIRTAQRQTLQGKHNMTPLYVQREHIYRSFENQVLVTPSLDGAKKVLVIIHDPPQLLAQPDVVDTTLEPHNSWVVDGVTDYIDWAVKEGFGVMDINVPAYLTQDEDMDPFIPKLNEKELQQQITSLVCYLWDNYIQMFSADEIFLMGVGNAYLGVKVLLVNRECKERISGIVNFVTGNLRPVKSDIDERLSAWYKDNSRVYVAGDHACWSDPDLMRKVNKRRFGSVVRSPAHGLNRMMRTHAAEAHEWILERVTDHSSGETTEEDDDNEGA
ncbi:histone deacetylase 6 [Geosmithia morbida]|uniref:Histone deacetylase n=1 Tax=Geosmithia morbida TaxID=1094350 RepID=A0A9P5D2M0_9HYPO|nr:histone deacetylase 6 [Geosmithia morbida]KAF4120950.1 histone deacetylase 6 [Geosmithia morbida]